MTRNQELKKIENNLYRKFINIDKNEVILRENDFDNNKLTKSGYISLKQQSDYISVNEEIEIKIPEKYLSGFTDQLEYVTTKELIRIKKDMKEVNISALIFFLVGLLLLVLPAIFDVFKTEIINDIIVIVSWVFTWASVEKKFFEMHRLKNRRQNLLHIISSEIKTY